MPVAQPDLSWRAGLDANRQPRFRLDIVPEPGWGQTLRIGLGFFFAQHGSEQIEGRTPRVRQVIEHGNDGYPLSRQIETMAAPATQRAAMADGRATELRRAGKTEAVS